MVVEEYLHLLEDLLDLRDRPGAVDELGHRRGAVPHVRRDQRQQRHSLEKLVDFEVGRIGFADDRVAHSLEKFSVLLQKHREYAVTFILQQDNFVLQFVAENHYIWLYSLVNFQIRI